VDHPRIRGEHGHTSSRLVGVMGSSPHTRGAHQRPIPHGLSPRIIPAYAGSTKGHRPTSRPSPDHPRIRGEHWYIWYGTHYERGSSPHTRGALPRLDGGQPPNRIIPAYAGSTSSVYQRGRFPLGSSPHTRGARHPPGRHLGAVRIIPAYAGSTITPSSSLRWSTDHPRIRWEHINPHDVGDETWGSSPHTRGARVGHHRAVDPVRIIPAYAGSTAPSTAQVASSWIIPAYAGSTYGHYGSTFWDSGSSPHTRGEHVCPNALCTHFHGSSPHTRGAQLHHGQAMRDLRIIPAYAGSTYLPLPDGGALFGSSPHTRGAPARSSALVVIPGIIPAYAGSTWRTGPRPRCIPDHPRIRGEHMVTQRNGQPATGSSPHTRGAPLRHQRPPGTPRIIPAYAGSTLSDQLSLGVHLLISISSYNLRSRQEPLTAWG
jgi:hypothetical protein